MNKNIGTISNSGIELSLNFDIFNTRDFSWSIGTEGTFVKNKVIALPDGKDILRGVQQVSEGHSIYEYYTYNFEGVDQLTGRSLYTADPDKIEKAKSDNAYVKIGDKEYVYKNSYAKKVWSGSALPTYYGSLNTNLNWKGFGINALFTYSLGGKMYDSAYASLMSTASASSASANHVDILDSWMSAPKGMKENDPNRINPTGIPAIDFSRSTDNNAQSNRWLVSSSYLTFKNLGISYSLPKSWVNAIELSEVTFSFGAENLFTLTARKGLNPQFDFAGGSDDTYVTARVYNFGLNLKF